MHWKYLVNITPAHQTPYHYRKEVNNMLMLAFSSNKVKPDKAQAHNYAHLLVSPPLWL